MTRGG